MRKTEIKKSKDENFAEWLHAHESADQLIWGLIGIILSVLPIFLSFFVYKPQLENPALFSTARTSAYFASSIVILGIIIVAVASLLRHKHRDVIRLKQRLAEIYLIALKKSALNPGLKSSDQND